jgi:hypothetical protein
MKIDGETLDSSVTDTPDDGSGDVDGSDDPDDPDEDFSMYEGAVIRIVHPESGDFLPLGEVHSFEAVIVNPEGDELPFDDVFWDSDSDDEWTPVGGEVEDDTIDVGRHNITAQVALPDGSRLAHTVGGVLVQHEDAGTYVGDMILSMDTEIGGTPIGASSIGAAFVVVDEYGDAAEGASACTMDLLGYMTIPVDHSFAYDLDETDLDGNAFVDIPFMGSGLPFPSDGSIDDGDILTTWEGGVSGIFELDGTLDVTRITREITEL